MIDIHSHILPMVDDGAASVEMALELVAMAYENGTDAIVLTPHFADAYGFENPYEKIKYLFEDFQYIVKQEKIPIQLYLGSEYLFSSFENFLRHRNDITTLNHSKYLLTEFFFDVSSDFVFDAVSLILETGHIPIIAHPERFECLQEDFEMIEKLIQAGALLQVNKGSLLGKYGTYARETALEIMDHHYYHFIGSDAHHPLYRSSRLNEDFDLIQRLYGNEYANRLFYENPRNMLKNQDIRKKANNEKRD